MKKNEKHQKNQQELSQADLFAKELFLNLIFISNFKIILSKENSILIINNILEHK